MPRATKIRVSCILLLVAHDTDVLAPWPVTATVYRVIIIALRGCTIHVDVAFDQVDPELDRQRNGNRLSRKMFPLIQ